MHEGWCKANPNEIVRDDHCRSLGGLQSPCNCPRTKIKHKPDCLYCKDLREIAKKYTETPIIGYNSGKYDLTFILGELGAALN